MEGMKLPEQAACYSLTVLRQLEADQLKWKPVVHSVQQVLLSDCNRLAREIAKSMSGCMSII